MSRETACASQTNNHEFFIKSDGFHTKIDGVNAKYDGFHAKNDGFCSAGAAVCVPVKRWPETRQPDRAVAERRATGQGLFAFHRTV